jgi:hypothetical protein
MRTLIRGTMLGLGLLATLALSNRLAAADGLTLEGNWKLVVSPLGDTEFLILKAQTKDSKPAAEVINFNPQLGDMEIRKIEQQGDSLTLTISARGADNVFKGALAKEGEMAGQILGVFNFLGRGYPARLEKTEADKVSTASAPPAGYQAYQEAMRERDPKAKAEKLQAAATAMKGASKSAPYLELLRGAAAAGLSEQQVRDTLKELEAAVKPYGTSLVADHRINALKALQGKKEYAAVSLELAQETEKSLPAEASLEQQAGIQQAIASAAKLAGKNDLAEAAAAKADKIEHQLDEEYHKKVPPFKPDTFAGRQNKEHDRVVLMELFTGAQCPPCVAADVAFDALLSTYKPTEFIGLQYHLHIPGPDPMTNADSEARAKFYGVNSTPSTLFNGKPAAGGGGAMANSQSKYQQYRTVIDEQLAAAKEAKIDLRLTRSGDQIMVAGTAQAKGGENSKLRVRLVLTEEIVRYVGGNQLRFHHHVVRGLPGGVEGKELVGGEASISETISLADVRKTLASYLESYGRPFANTPPEMGNELSIVAFVQDDADKRVLHAVAMPIPKK